MSVKQDVVNLLVNINGNQAQDRLNNLRKSAADIRSEMQGLKKNTDEYRNAANQLKDVNSQMAALKSQIGITSLSQKELTAEMKRLLALKGQLTPFSSEFNEVQKQIKAVGTRLSEVRSGTDGFKKVIGDLVPQMRGFGAVMLAAFAFQAIRQNIAAFIRDLAGMSNQLSDIQRVTGMTKAQVDNLDSSLKKIDTATAVTKLRDLAIVAGKLGVANKDILAFVAATDKLVVALGDELGDADAITTNLGKIINVFDSEGGITGDKLLHIGNAIVDLANKGVATGGYIVDFTQRLSGIAKAAGVALPAVIGLAAGFEESGLRVESSSTALQNLLGLMGKNVQEFARVAGKDLSTFAKTVRENPVEALIELAQGAIKNKTGFAELAPVFKELEANGVRVQQVLATLGAKGDFFREKIQEAGAALQDTGEITQAFLLKNDNLSANLSKIGKEFTNFTHSTEMVDFFNGMAKSVLSFINALKELPSWLEANKSGIYLLFVGLVLLNKQYIVTALSIIRETAAKVLNAVATKIKAAADITATVAMSAYQVATELLTGRITLATAATRSWTIATKGGLAVIGGLIAIIGAAILIYNSYNSAFDSSITKSKLQAEVGKAVSDSIQDQKMKIEQLVNAVNNHNLSLDTRKKALQELINQNPNYLQGLTAENIKTQEGIGIINSYIDSLDRLAKAKALTDIKAKLEKDRLEQSLTVQTKKEAADKEGFLSNAFGSVFGTSDEAHYTDALHQYNETTGKFILAQGQINDRVKELNFSIDAQTLKVDKLKKGTDAYNAAQRDLASMQNERNIYLGIQDISKPSASSSAAGGVQTGTETDKQKNFEARRKEFLEDIKNLQAQVDSINQTAQTKEFAQLSESQAKQLTAVQDKYAQLLAKAKKFGFDSVQIEHLREQDLNQLFSKFFQQQSDLEYTQSLAYSKDFYDKKKDLANQSFLSGEIGAKAYKDKIADIDAQELQQKVNIAKEYALTSKKAADDEVQYSKKASDKAVQNKLSEVAQKNKAAKQEADAQLIYDEASLPRGSEELFQEKLKDLEAQKAAAIQNAKDTGASVYAVQLLYAAKEKALAREHIDDLQKNNIDLLQSKVSVNEMTLPKGSNIALDTKKALLEAQFNLETETLDKTGELYKQKEKEKNAAIEDMTRQSFQDKFDNIMQYVNAFGNAMDSIMNLANANDQAQLAKDKALNDAKQKSLQKQLNGKQISQAVYDKKTQALQDDMDKKEKEMARKKAERDKTTSIFSAITGTASAVVGALGNKPWTPANFVLAALVGAAGLAEIGTIIATPLPELGTGGLIENGPKHRDAQKGLHVVNPETGKTEMLLERGEAVLSASAMDDKKEYTIKGTPSQITSTLNGIHGGSTWARNATLVPKWQQVSAPRINPGMVQVMATGGLIGGIARDAPNQMTSYNNVDPSGGNNDLANEIKRLSQAVENFPTRMKADVVLQDLWDQEKLYEQARRAGRIG